MKVIVLFLYFLIIAASSFASNAPSREERIEKAREIHSRLIRIEQYIPNLTPDQARYVANEREEISRIDDRDAKLSRLVKLEESKEAQIEKIKTIIKYASNALITVTKDDVNTEKEILLWLVFVSYFMDPSTLDSAITILKNNDVISASDINKMGLYKSSFGYGQFLAWNSKTVIDEIVIPLQYQIMADCK